MSSILTITCDICHKECDKAITLSIKNFSDTEFKDINLDLCSECLDNILKIIHR